MTTQITATDTARRMGDLAYRAPVEIDTVLASLDTEYHHLVGQLNARIDRLHYIAGDRKRDTGRRTRIWCMDDDAAINAAADKIDTGTVDLRYWIGAADDFARYRTLAEQVAANRAEFDRLDAEYARRRWTRFIACVHIHSGYHCVGGSLDRGHYRSERHWKPEFSGMDEAAAIAELNRRAVNGAETLCTHCFPNAPVVKPAEQPGKCTNKTYDPSQPHRKGFAAGNFATCDACYARASLTRAGNLIKHDRGPGIPSK